MSARGDSLRFGRRLLHLIPVLFGITFAVFVLIHVVPGDPARAMLGITAPAERIQALREEWGLDRPLLVQYTTFLGRLVRGDLSDSLHFRRPVLEVALERLPATAWLLGYATVMAVALSVPIATLAATKKDS